MGFARILLRSATAAFAAGLALTPQLVAAADGLPDGSWRQSCHDGQVSNGVLYAQCRREDGRYRAASATLGSCLAFANRNGDLVCERAADNRDSADGWRGSFRDTCTDVSVDRQGKLKARCLKDNGTYRSTNLSLWKCLSRQAANRDGRLVCDRSGSGSQGASEWKGSFRQSCRDLSVDSAGTLTATCQRSNGNWQRSSLSTRQCSDLHAGNRDGTLFCEG
jgi:hypothetical protein